MVYQGLPDSPDEPSPAENGTRMVLSVGAFIPHKDQQTLLRAWQLVEEGVQFPDTQLVLVGNGPTRRPVRSWLASSG